MTARRNPRWLIDLEMERRQVAMQQVAARRLQLEHAKRTGQPICVHGLGRCVLCGVNVDPPALKDGPHK